MQEEVARLTGTLQTMDAFVTKTESALALEQALNQASQLQKDDVLGRMESLATQVRIPGVQNFLCPYVRGWGACT